MNINNCDYNKDEQYNNSDNDSFQSALCEMYNDVLCLASHSAVIPEEETVYFADATGEDEASYAKSQSRLLTRKPSFVSCRSTTGCSTASSYLLSVGETEDDDLSFMTEGSFDDRSISTPSTGPSANCTSIEMSKSMEPSESALSIETSRQTDQDTYTKELNVPSTTATSKTTNVAKLPNKNDILGHGDCGVRNSLNLSDLDAALVSPSIQTSYPECSSTLDCSDISELTQL